MGAEDRARGEWARGRARGGERGAQSAARAAGRRRAAAAAEKERALPAAARAAPPGNRDPARTRAVLQRQGLARSAGDVPAAPAPRSATGSHAHTRPGPRRLPAHVLPPRALASQAPTHGRAASSGERRTPQPRQPCRCRDTWEGQPGSSVHPTLPPPPSCSLAPSVCAGARGSLWLLHAEARLELGTESSPTGGPEGWRDGGRGALQDGSHRLASHGKEFCREDKPLPSSFLNRAQPPPPSSPLHLANTGHEIGLRHQESSSRETGVFFPEGLKHTSSANFPK